MLANVFTHWYYALNPELVTTTLVLPPL